MVTPEGQIARKLPRRKTDLLNCLLRARGEKPATDYNPPCKRVKEYNGRKVGVYTDSEEEAEIERRREEPIITSEDEGEDFLERLRRDHGDEVTDQGQSEDDEEQSEQPDWYPPTPEYQSSDVEDD